MSSCWCLRDIEYILHFAWSKCLGCPDPSVMYMFVSTWIHFKPMLLTCVNVTTLWSMVFSLNGIHYRNMASERIERWHVFQINRTSSVKKLIRFCHERCVQISVELCHFSRSSCWLAISIELSGFLNMTVMLYCHWLFEWSIIIMWFTQFQSANVNHIESSKLRKWREIVKSSDIQLKFTFNF